MLKASQNSEAERHSAAPVILEGDNHQALLSEALRLAAVWTGEERKVLAGQHVDVTLLDNGPEGIIKVGDVRSVRRGLLLRPFDGDVKVHIIAHAHNMNASAQNALLLLLEEPPPYARFILLSKNAGMLLPTVRSRCTVRRMAGQAAVGAAEEDLARAQAFVDALETPWERMRIAFSWEKCSRDALKGILRAVLLCLRERCLHSGACALYIETIDMVSSLMDALEQNASAGSVCGVLAISKET